MEGERALDGGAGGAVGGEAVGGDGLTAKVREICLGLPEVTERLSHGSPAFYVRDKKQFVMLWPDGHHDHGFPHLWCAAPPGAQASLAASDPDKFFRPPYVGGRGWIGVRLDAPSADSVDPVDPVDPVDSVDWTEIAELCEDAYRAVAPARLIAQLDG